MPDDIRMPMAISRQIKYFVCLLLVFLAGCGPRIYVREVTVYPTENAQPSSGGVITGELVYEVDGELLSMNAGSGHRQNLTDSAAYETAPAWSPDGAFLAYIVRQEGADILYAAPATLPEDRRWQANFLTNLASSDSSPAWSSDGRYIAFSSFQQDSWGIYVTELGVYLEVSTPVIFSQRRLTYNKSIDAHPDWSPDGRLIAYTSDRGLRWQIYTMEPTGAQSQPFPGTEHLASTAYPSWSPDNASLAFASTHNGDWDIYTLKADGTELKQLTTDPAQDWHPDWSPDGQWIAFVSDRGGQQDLYVVSVDGARLFRLTDTPQAEDYPDWNPQSMESR